MKVNLVRCAKEAMVNDANRLAVFDALPMGLVYCDLEGTIIEANAQAREMLGLRRDDASGGFSRDERFTRLREDGAVLPENEDPVSRVLASGQAVSDVVVGMVAPEGGPRRWFKAHGAPLARPGETTPYLVFAAFQEITEQINAEERGKDLARFPEDNPNPVLRISQAGLILYANKASLTLLEGLGTKAGGIAPEGLRAFVDQALASDEIGSFEIFVRGVLFLFSVAPFAREGFCHVYGMEVTDLKRAEWALRRERDFSDTALSMAGSLVIVLDPEGRIVRFNKACAALTGYSFEEVRGRMYREILVPEDQSGEAQTVFEKVKAGDFPNVHENEWKTKDGGRRAIAWMNTALVGEYGEVERIVGIGVDLTERRASQRAREREIHTLECLSAPASATITAATLGLKRLSEAHPETFAASVSLFGELLDKSLEMLALKVEHDVSKGVDALCERLGRLRAGPRDAAEIYLTALREKSGHALPEKKRGYLEEGRILLIELLGKLAVYYRNHCLGSVPPSAHGKGAGFREAP